MDSDQIVYAVFVFLVLVLAGLTWFHLSKITPAGWDVVKNDILRQLFSPPQPVGRPARRNLI